MRGGEEMRNIFRLHSVSENRPVEEQLNEAKQLVLVSVFTTFTIFVGLVGVVAFHMGYWEALRAVAWTLMPVPIFLSALRILRLLRWID